MGLDAPVRAPRTSAPIDLPTDLIIIRDRLRPIDPNRVANLRVSMAENGFIGSITVRPLGESGKFRIVVGAHRLTAWREEGQRSIPCQIRVLTDDEALQIEIDENLVRDDCSPLERAEMLSRRFEVWARRFPDRVAASGAGTAPKRGRPGNSVNMTEFTQGAPETMGFAADTAAQLGLSKTTIERAWRTVNGIPADLRRQLHGTPLARNEGLLRQLANVADKAEQAQVAELLIGGKAKAVPEAMALATGRAPIAAAKGQVDRLAEFQALWRRMTASERKGALEWQRDFLPAGWSLSEDQG